MKYIITLTLAVSLILLTTESKAQMRLLAKAHRMYDSTGNILEDSTTYFHSGAKGANPGKFKIPEFELMEDSMHVFAKSGSSMKWIGRRVSTYTGADFKESIYYVWSDSSNSWRNSLRTRIIYANNKPDTVYYDTWGFGNNWRATSRIIYTWNNNNISTRLRQVYQFGQNPGWRNNRMHTYQYSGNNETSFIDQKWNSGAWADTFKRETTYAAGKVSQINWFNSSGGSWVDQSRYIYNYDGSSRVTLIQQDIYTGTWENDNGRDSFYYNGTSQYPDTMVRIQKIFPPNFTNVGKWAYKHLYDGRLTELLTISWNGVDTWKQTNNQDSIDNWYYGWPASVANMEVANDRINVYPSPASQNIHITVDGVEPGKQVHLAIMDMQGRLVKNWEDNPAKKMSMSISGFPAGNYILHATDGTFTASRQFVVVE